MNFVSELMDIRPLTRGLMPPPSRERLSRVRRSLFSLSVVVPVGALPTSFSLIQKRLDGGLNEN